MTDSDLFVFMTRIWIGSTGIAAKTCNHAVILRRERESPFTMHSQSFVKHELSQGLPKHL